MIPIELRRGEGRVQLQLRALPMGDDLCVLLDGGDRPHIGALALGRPGTAAVLPVPGHREAELAQSLAARLADGLGRTVAVACGIHLDAITTEEIATVVRLAESLVDDLLRTLR